MKRDKHKKLTRRNFFKLLTRLSLGLASILGLGGLVRYFSLSPDQGLPTSFEIGQISEFPPGSIIFRPDIPAVIYNRQGKFVALSLSCTHLGCILEEELSGFSCPCHGSRFDGDGKVVTGPADQNLPMLDIELNEAGILILSTKGAGK